MYHDIGIVLTGQWFLNYSPGALSLFWMWLIVFDIVWLGCFNFQVTRLLLFHVPIVLVRDESLLTATSTVKKVLQSKSFWYIWISLKLFSRWIQNTTVFRVACVLSIKFGFQIDGPLAFPACRCPTLQRQCWGSILFHSKGALASTARTGERTARWEGQNLQSGAREFQRSIIVLFYLLFAEKSI